MTIAASVTTSGTGVGGVIDAIVMDNHVSSLVGASARITAGSDIDVLASAKANLLLAALSFAGSGSATAVGGTLAVVVTNTITLAEVKAAARLTSTNGSITVSALSEDEFINVLAAASVSGGGTAVAGTLGVLIALNQTSAKIDDGAILSGKNDVSLLSFGKTGCSCSACRSARQARTPWARPSAYACSSATSKRCRRKRKADFFGGQRAGAGKRRELGAAADACSPGRGNQRA